MLDNFRVRLSGLGPLALRIGVGVGFATHGWGKLVALYYGTNPLHGIVGNERLATVLAWMQGGTEFIGGVCVLAGLLTRFWAAGMVIGMVVAMLKMHRADMAAFLPNLWHAAQKGFTHPYQFSDAMLKVHLASAELAWIYLTGALALFLLGPGAFSLDYLFGLIYRRRRANAVVGCGMRFPAKMKPLMVPAPPVQPVQPVQLRM